MSGTSEATTSASQPSSEHYERLAIEMEAAWKRGERLLVEHYLARHPKLAQSEGVIRLIYEEACLRQERGDKDAQDQLARRFPRWARELAVMLDCHNLVHARLAPADFPNVGESLGDFALLAELGRGKESRVFLARQSTLANRPVVIKVTPRSGQEFQSLARLQHTNIIPLYGVHEFPTRNLRVLCEPFLGGATLASLLEQMRGVAVGRRTGRMLVEALDTASRSGPITVPNRGDPRAALAKATYVDAICYLMALLADGLQYAHERGVVHLDIKPSNILLASDGQPLLLDFHLALEPLMAGQPAPDELGGTPGYMSPEQERAFTAAAQGKPVPDAVDGRSDIFSLGRVLYAALGGDEPAADQKCRSLRRCNPQVSVGLSDVIRKSLLRAKKTAIATQRSLRRICGVIWPICLCGVCPIARCPNAGTIGDGDSRMRLSGSACFWHWWR